MGKQKYLDLHPNYNELEVVDYATHKLQLITPSIEFAQESLNWVSDREVGQYMGADFTNVTLEGERKRLTEIVNDTNAYHWLIVCDGKVVGNININEIAKISKEFEVKSGKLNYLIGDKNLWGKGIATAVAKKVLDWAFSVGEFEVIKSRVLPQNISSQAVLKKLCFIEFGKEDYDGPSLGKPTWYRTYKITNLGVG